MDYDSASGKVRAFSYDKLICFKFHTGLHEVVGIRSCVEQVVKYERLKII
jgi:hypothetical protein